MRSFALALVLLAALAGSALPAAQPSRTETKKAAAPALSDAELEKAIRARFAKSKIAANHFQVKVVNGTATLTGRTEVIQHKATATRMARAAGARAVENRIEISESARRRAGEKLARTRPQVKRVPAAPQ
jgi:osmotically-inducible protein OsmY